MGERRKQWGEKPEDWRREVSLADRSGKRKSEHRPRDLGDGPLPHCSLNSGLSQTKERCNHFPKAMADLVLSAAPSSSDHMVL